MKLHKIRELFWPILEKNGRVYDVKDISINEIKFKNVDKLIDHILKRYDAEEDRRKSVEGKAALFINSMTIITTVTLGITTLYFKEINNSGLLTTMVLFLLIYIAYMCKSLWFAVKTLERKTFHSLSPKDFYGNETEKKVVVAITNKIQKNYDTINSKVDCMTMAQEFYKRAICVLSIYIIISLLIILKASLYSLLGITFIQVFFSLIIISITLNVVFIIKNWNVNKNR